LPLRPDDENTRRCSACRGGNLVLLHEQAYETVSHRDQSSRPSCDARACRDRAPIYIAGASVHGGIPLDEKSLFAIKGEPTMLSLSTVEGGRLLVPFSMSPGYLAGLGTVPSRAQLVRRTAAG